VHELLGPNTYNPCSANFQVFITALLLKVPNLRDL
jgi:hypothetical protein